MNKKIFFISSFILIFSFIFLQAAKYENKIVKKIEFLGLVNTSEADLNEIIRTTVGYPLKNYEIRKDLKDIFAQGSYEQVEVKVRRVKGGVEVRFKCQERSYIQEIEFKGMDEFIETNFEGIIPFKEGDFLSLDLIKKSLSGIEEKYQTEGFFNMVVTYKIEELNKEENTVKIIFIIDEGEEVKVEKIIIRGAEKVDPDDLYDLMETEEDGFISDGSFNKDIYEQDKDKIINYYKELGFLDAQIIDDKVEYRWENPLTKEKRVIYIVIKIREGGKYFFNKYNVSITTPKSRRVYQPEIFFDEFRLKESGEVFNNTKFQLDRHMISFKYASKGYIFSRVVPRKKIFIKKVKDEDEQEVERKFVTVDFTVNEGSEAYIDSIIIKGNTKTKNNIISREIVLKEGDLFDARKMEISRERVYNLGFFKEVNFDVRPGSKDGYMNLIVDVEEQATGNISLGGGYGTSSGFSIFANIGEKNLLGNGQELAVKFEYGPEKSSITLSFAENWLLGYPLGFSSSIFYSRYRITTTSIFPTSGGSAKYEKELLGYSSGLSYRFWYYYTLGTRWEHAFKNYINPTGNSSDEVFNLVASKIQEKRTLSFYCYRNSKDNYLNPTSGTNLGTTVAFTGGFLKGEDHFIELKPKFYAYYSPFDIPFLETRYPCVFEFRVSGIFIRPPWGISKDDQDYEDDKWLETEDRLTIGGFRQGLRSWSYQDSNFPVSWQGYNLFHKILYGLEFRIPIHPQMLWLAFFFDAGSLWSDKYWEKHMDDEISEIIDEDLEEGKLRRINEFRFNEDLLYYFKYSYGVGFKIQIPMLPLRFWFGRKMIYDGSFKTISDYNFDFEIGDVRF